MDQPPTPNNQTEPAGLQVSERLLQALAEAVSERVIAALRPRLEAQHSPWLRLDEAAAYSKLPKNSLYKLTAAAAIPARKARHGQGLRFHRDELDQWLRSTYLRLDERR